MNPGADPAADAVLLDAVRAALDGLPRDAAVAVAYSGGIDSAVLLHAAVAVAGPQRIVALHVHHGLSPNADAWLAHCAATAKQLRVRFEARRVQVATGPAQSLEAAAREARYAALDALCQAHDAPLLLLGQHADDQAETVLLQLLRGAGLPGLAAMPLQRRTGARGIVRARPLLAVLRGLIEAYAARHGVRWVDDESNQDSRYARNALRNEILPPLGVHFPGYRDALARTARHAADAQRLLDELALIDLRAAALDADARTLSRGALNDLSAPRAANLLRYWLRLQGLPAASEARLTNMLMQLREARPGAALRLAHAGRQLRVYRDAVAWQTPQSGRPSVAAAAGAAAERQREILHWQGEPAWHLPLWHGTLIFAAALADEPHTVSAALLRQWPLSARVRSGGERMRAAPAAPSRTLKNLFQEAGVPPWRRAVPLIFLGDTLLYVPGLGLNGALASVAGTTEAAEAGVRLTWQEDLLLA